MATLTLEVNLETAKRARRVAEQQHTTLDSLVEEYREEIARTEERARMDAAEHLMRTLRAVSRPMGGKPWQDRDELHER
jgi:hypothetical protein